jgi:hypothetical protein
MVKQLKKEKAQVEQWNARQQEDTDFKKREKNKKHCLRSCENPISGYIGIILC